MTVEEQIRRQMAHQTSMALLHGTASAMGLSVEELLGRCPPMVGWTKRIGDEEADYNMNKLRPDW